MKKTTFLILLSLIAASTTFARLIPYCPYGELMQSSDMVAVVEVGSIDKTNAVLQGHGDAGRFQGYVAHAKIAWVIKGDKHRKELDIVFFGYAGNVGEDDGALFIDFREREKCQYLVFLKKDDVGNFVPATGHYDASISVKKIQKDGFSGVPRTAP